MLFFLLPLFGAIKSESYPQKLSDEEERMYLLRYANQKDEIARAKLIEHNLRLVAHIAKKYENTNEDKDDILSIGILGLMKAVDSYQVTANNKLATYAARCIENEILMHLRANKNKRNLVYLQSPVAMDKDGNEVELLDLMEDKSIDIMASYEKKAMHKDLDDALKTLNSREYEIIARRYGINRDSQTQKEIAKDMNISRSYVSRIEKRALLKLYFLLKK
ncbi:MAG: RNA polymerase sporulation sigma factor SigK [Acholeplasmatales bacterium]|jgi:RNA polymerase sporulation-specific sigma factor|nr:RNA polymerase sporulation sigma factor SigK [Acholeplasmatales bacterium]MCI9654069.1 RNA polymerase sporulation sigma factor SigK [Acholeplasmatales bacterium]